MLAIVHASRDRGCPVMAQVTLRYSQQELLGAFERAGVINVDLEDGDDFAEYVNALIIFLNEEDGFALNETAVAVDKKDASKLRVTLVAGCSYPDRFLGGLRAFQEFMFLASG